MRKNIYIIRYTVRINGLLRTHSTATKGLTAAKREAASLEREGAEVLSVKPLN